MKRGRCAAMPRGQPGEIAAKRRRFAAGRPTEIVALQIPPDSAAFLARRNRRWAGQPQHRDDPDRPLMSGTRSRAQLYWPAGRLCAAGQAHVFHWPLGIPGCDGPAASISCSGNRLGR